jgi:hypothetical protein
MVILFISLLIILCVKLNPNTHKNAFNFYPKTVCDGNSRAEFERHKNRASSDKWE